MNSVYTDFSLPKQQARAHQTFPQTAKPRNPCYRITEAAPLQLLSNHLQSLEMNDHQFYITGQVTAESQEAAFLCQLFQ